MQFLMGPDDVFGNVRSSILITEPLPDVKSHFATLSRDDSHGANNVHSIGKSSSTAFVSKSNNDCSVNKSNNQNNQNRRFNRGPNHNLVCKHYNMIGHSIDSSGNTYVLTSDEYQKLMGLLRSSGSGTACDICNVTVILDVLVILGYEVSLLYVHKLASANKLSVIVNETDCLIQDSTQKFLVGTGSMIGGLYFLDQGGIPMSMWTECVLTAVFLINRLPYDVLSGKKSVEKPASVEGSTDLNAKPKSGHAVAKDFASHPASTSGKTVDATSDDENYDSEGEEFGKFDLLFGSYEGDLERVVVDESARRSSRKTSLPSKLKDYEIQGKVNYGSSDDIERYKARLVVKGYSQKEGLNYEETFSPVVKMVTVRCVLSLVVQNSWPCIHEDVYMSLPKGLFVHGDQRVYKLKKSLYGLKQTPEKWNEKLSIVLCDIRPAIFYALHKLSQAMHGLLKSDLKLAFRVLRRFVVGFAVFLGSCLMSWKRKKQSVLAKSSAEAEYRAMSNVACEIIWILKILTDLKVEYTILIQMFCDSSAAMQIAANLIFHERTKHFEVGLYFLKEKINEGVFRTCKV
ncbi:ribonuclease H-like domain-containing protein [Tanacetum coccineum]